MISPHEQPVVQWGAEPNNNYYNYYNPQCYILPNPPAPNHQPQPIQSPDATNQSNSPYAQPVQQPTTSHLHAESALPYYNNYDHQLNHLVPSYMPPTSIAYRPRKFEMLTTRTLSSKCLEVPSGVQVHRSSEYFKELQSVDRNYRNSTHPTLCWTASLVCVIITKKSSNLFWYIVYFLAKSVV